MSEKGKEIVDAIVIGSGQGGTPLASELARNGRKTVLIEREHIGGTCVNEGCTPTKTMIASARVAYLASRAPEYGVDCGPVSVDLARVRMRKREIVESFRGGNERRVRSTEGLEWIHGEAAFVGPHEVEVTSPDRSTRHLEAPWIFVDTGSRARIPDFDGIDAVPFLTSTSIMELAEVPEHLVIIGGGYVGVEFAQMFRRFGSRVTILHRHAQLLTHEDDDIAKAVAAILNEDGVDLVFQAQPTAVRHSGAHGIELDIKQNGKQLTFSASHLLVAAGRVPNTDALHLERAGIAIDEGGFVPVDDRLETAVPGVYALGDVKGGPAFTHISYDDYRIIRDRLIRGQETSTRGRMVPYTVFIDPQLGRIGYTETQARQAGLPIRIARMPMNQVARALEVDEPRGLLKAVVHAKTGRILGAAILGLQGGELIAILQVAMMGDLPYTALRDATLTHPTLAEAFNNLFADLES